MRLEILFCLILLAINVNCEDCAKVKCEPAPKHYEELDCTPVVKKGKCCPSRFDCSTFKNRDATKCHFKNQSIAVGENLDSDEIRSTCTAACYCRKPSEDQSRPELVCAHIDCAELFRGPPKGKKCVRQYKPDSCCSSGTVCDGDLEKLATCEVDGRTYYEGEKIDTKGSCYSCICGKGYENKPFEQNKHCKRTSCNLDLHGGREIERGCIPVYYKSDQCCPFDWRCPNNETTVVPDSSGKKISKDPLRKCTFGKLLMNVGDVLSPENDKDKCTLCSCKTPPFAHCVKTCEDEDEDEDEEEDEDD